MSEENKSNQEQGNSQNSNAQPNIRPPSNGIPILIPVYNAGPYYGGILQYPYYLTLEQAQTNQHMQSIIPSSRIVCDQNQVRDMSSQQISKEEELQQTQQIPTSQPLPLFVIPTYQLPLPIFVSPILPPPPPTSSSATTTTVIPTLNNTCEPVPVYSTGPLHPVLQSSELPAYYQYTDEYGGTYTHHLHILPQSVEHTSVYYGGTYTHQQHILPQSVEHPPMHETEPIYDYGISYPIPFQSFNE